MSSFTDADREVGWFAPDKRIDIAYELAGTSNKTPSLRLYHMKRLKELEDLRPIEIDDIIRKEHLNILPKDYSCNIDSKPAKFIGRVRSNGRSGRKRKSHKMEA